MKKIIFFSKLFRTTLIRFVLFFSGLLFFDNLTVAQNDSIGVFLQRDEYSPFSGIKKFMWVDLKNIVTSTLVGSAEILNAYTSNGDADKPSYYANDQCAITPNMPGEVTVMAIQRVRNKDGWDTVTTVTSFIAIEQPEIRLMILNDSMASHCRLQFFLADKYNFQPLTNRYLITNYYETLFFDEEEKFIGKLPRINSNIIDCGELNLPFTIKKGYRMVLQVMVRDMETDLLIPADEWVHIVE